MTVKYSVEALDAAVSAACHSIIQYYHTFSTAGIRAFLLIALLINVIGINNATAQRQHLRFEQLSTEAGLSQSNILCILQDSRGFMWFGTRDGLNKFDSHKFTVYKHSQEDTHSISNDEIMDIKEDADGNLWIATFGGGLNMFDWQTEKFTRYWHDANNPGSIPTDYLHCVYIDDEDIIWVGTSRGGLSRFDRRTGNITTYVHDPDNINSISGNSITGIQEDKSHNLWIGTIREGLNLFNKKTKSFKRFYGTKEVPAPIEVETLFVDSKERLWIPAREGLYLLNDSTSKFRYFKNDHRNENSIRANVVLSIAEDEEGMIWIGTENGGLSLYNPDIDRFVHYAHDDVDEWSLSNNSIWSLYRDKKGNMWVGTFSGGINFASRDANQFTHYRHTSFTNSLSNNSVWAILEDSRKDLWIGTDGGGLNVLDRKSGTFKSHRHDGTTNSLCGDHVLSLAEDGDGNLWIGTWGTGITVFNKEKNTFRHFRHDRNDPDGISTPNVWTIFRDSRDNMWVGTYSGGVDVYDKGTGKFIHYHLDENNPKSLPSNTVNVFFEDSKKNMWVGTHGGLSRLDKNKNSFTNFRHSDTSNSLSDNRVYSIFEDSRGTLWIGTEAGLNKFDVSSNQFTTYTIKDGLPGNRIFGILDDKSGNLWISTNNGISMLNPSTGIFTNFSVENGLQGKEFRKAAWKSPSGELYFGGVYGFNEFSPEDIRESRYISPLVFTDFHIFNQHVPISNDLIKTPLEKSITATSKITMPYDQSVISFEFASLNYLRNKARYVYKLEGFDKEWNDVGTKHNATYTNLDAGTYTFIAGTRNRGGEVSENTISLQLTITPPYWETWWFRLLLSLTIIGSAVSYSWNRVNTIKKQKIELEKQVAERTYQLSEANDVLTKQKQELATQTFQLEELYNEVKDSIKAAQIIQHSILPSLQHIGKFFPEAFILNMPKDEVSGDFYWFNERDENIIIAAGDCTGHGVSGALMAINGHHLLNQSVYNNGALSASQILNKLNEGIIKELHHEDHETMIQNGMDIALCIIDKNKQSLQFAGSVMPLYILRDHEIIQVKGDGCSLGLVLNGKTTAFKHKDVPLRKGDIIYLFSDGYADQIGGPTGKDKFLYTRFRKLLLQIGDKDMDTQKKLLEENFLQWRNGMEQLDDILVIGLKV